MFLKIAEYFGILLVLIVVVTQVIIPAYKGRRLFPFFREPVKELEDQLVEATEKKAEGEIKEQIKDVKRQARSTTFQRQRQRDRRWKT